MFFVLYNLDDLDIDKKYEKTISSFSFSLVISHLLLLNLFYENSRGFMK